MSKTEWIPCGRLIVGGECRDRLLMEIKPDGRLYSWCPSCRVEALVPRRYVVPVDDRRKREAPVSVPGICVECFEERAIHAKGMCKSCYGRLRRVSRRVATVMIEEGGESHDDGGDEND